MLDGRHAGAGGDVGRQLRSGGGELLHTALASTSRSHRSRPVLQPRSTTS